MSSDSELDEFYDAEEETPIKLQRFDKWFNFKALFPLGKMYSNFSRVSQGRKRCNQLIGSKAALKKHKKWHWEKKRKRDEQ